MTILNIINSQINSAKMAIVDGNTTVTYGDLYRKIKINIEYLKKIKNSHLNVALLLPNSNEYIEWYYSIICSQSTAVPIYYRSSEYEIINIINSCNINVIITSESNVYNIIQNKKLILNKLYLIDINNNVELINKDKEFAKQLNKQDVAVMLSTSGSLQRPKRVMLTETNILTNAQSIIKSLKYQSSENILVLLPLCFASANTSQLIVSLILGATIVIYNDILHPRKIADAIRNFNVTSLTVVPSIFIKLVENDSFQSYGLNSLKTICFGGGPTSEKIIKAAASKFKNINLVQMYGQTEASSRISHMFINQYNNTCKIKSVGKPISGIQAKIVDDNGKELDSFKSGEITVCGENVMLGYYCQPEETKKVLKNNWLYTGDIGYQDEDGFLYITGRKKNMLIYSGINIYPEEIEDVISENENIADVLVYGIPDAELGELPVADIVLKNGCKLEQRELIEYCKAFLPLHKIPVDFNVVKSINYTKNGKKIRKIGDYR